MAERVGINKSTLQRYETDETPLSDGMIKKIAKSLRIKASVLMRDCLYRIRPKLKGSPFGELISRMVADGAE